MKPTFFATPAEFRAWFEANHDTAKDLLVGYYERGSGKPSITWPESVDEALCFGWTDGGRKSIDEDAFTIRFTPRKPTSVWSAINVAKVAALETLGRMTPAGRRAFEQRKTDRTRDPSFAAPPRVLPSRVEKAPIVKRARAARPEAKAPALGATPRRAKTAARSAAHESRSAPKKRAAKRPAVAARVGAATQGRVGRGAAGVPSKKKR